MLRVMTESSLSRQSERLTWTVQSGVSPHDSGGLTGTEQLFPRERRTKVSPTLSWLRGSRPLRTLFVVSDSSEAVPSVADWYSGGKIDVEVGQDTRGGGKSQTAKQTNSRQPNSRQPNSDLVHLLERPLSQNTTRR